MKKFLSTVFVLIFFSLALFSQSKDELAIRAVMDEQIKTWNSGNIDAFMQTYWKSDSLLFVGSKVPFKSKEPPALPELLKVPETLLICIF